MLEAHPDIERVFEIGHYRDLALLVAQKKPLEGANTWHIGLEDLAWGVANTPTPDLLLDLVELSHEKLSFFPQTIIRTLEYPWTASRMRDVRGQRILDIGAGVCALPLWLAGQGAKVVTVDYHTTIRDISERTTWNEWGFLDYAQFDPSVQSHNTDITTFEDPEGFDVIYSVSVIEHMPAELRRTIIARLPSLLRPGGRVLLTLDLVPGTFDLRPLSEGVVVDPEGTHGTLDTILDELKQAGLRVFDQTHMGAIPGSRTDLAMLDLRLAA
jgi:SAM-dependent methyltransferase